VELDHHTRALEAKEARALEKEVEEVLWWGVEPRERDLVMGAEISHKLVVDLEAALAAKAMHTWEIIKRMENVLVSLGFSPIHTGHAPRIVETTLPTVDTAREKLLYVHAVVDQTLEGEGEDLVHTVTKYVVACFCIRDLDFSLDSVIQGLVLVITDEAKAGLQEVAKLVASHFECQ
jgi:hypothetical protein